MDLVFVLSLGFLVALGTVGALVFPSALDGAGRFVARIAARGHRRAAQLWQRVAAVRGPGTARPRRMLVDAQGWLRDHAPLLGGSLALVLLPVGALLLFVDQRRLPGFEDRARSDNRVVTALLEGEQLVPPPPLPPDVFITREVTQLRPYLGGANREWSSIDPEFGQLLLRVFKAMEAQGYPMVLIEGYRSPERQAFLQAQGGGVTNAGAWQSYHQFGLAGDCAFFRDGRLILSEQDPWAAEGYRRFGIAAEAVGLTWGGRWTLRDFGHVERHKAGLLKKRPVG